MKKVHSVDYVIDALKILGENEYSLLWDLVDDFEVNGHKVSVKDSHQFKSVIIDGVYQRIGGNVTIVDADGVTYKDPLEYVRKLLSTKKGDLESMDFGKGTTKEIREAISQAAEKRLMEDRVINIFSNSSPEYKKLKAAAELLTLFTDDVYYVGETYFDYGQGWKWTTILEKDSTWGAVQALTPRDQENIITATTPTDLGKACDDVIHRPSYVPKKED